MKTFLLSTLLSFSLLQINAQCSNKAANFGNNTSSTSYNVNGDVSVVLNTNKTITLNLGSNFTTDAGPDVRAYLINSEGRTTAELKTKNPNDLDNIPLGLISCTNCSPVIPSNGAQTLTVVIPNGKDITKFDTVFFYCLQFTAFWDLGSFPPFTSTNCSVLNVDDFMADSISFFPNPAKYKIQFSNIDGISAEIRIFNVLGKQVFYQAKLTKDAIDISSFNKGIYIVKINVDGKSKTQKLVIQ